MDFGHVLFWKTKTPSDNDWRPRPGYDTTKSDIIIQQRPGLDLPAAIVDAVPFVCGAGSVAYLSQLNSLGWTVPASIFRNAKTLSALHCSAFLLPATVLACQATGFEYRNFIPRWSHDRERRRDETEVRQHIAIGSAVGLGIWAVRLFALRMGRGYRSPLLEIVIDGGLADLMDREDRKTHGL